MVEGAMDPPSGVTPNFDNPDKTIWTASIVTQALCISLVGAILSLRIYVRVHILRVFELEDWLIVIGFLLAVGYSCVALTMNHFGGGINAWEVPKKNIEPFGITVYCTMVLYGPCAFCIKASILVFLARVFAPIRRAVITIYIILGALLAYYLPVLGLKAAICRPVAKFWNPALDGQCFDQRALILADSVISVLSDMIIFAAPLPLTCNLHMQKKKRIKVAAIFSAGGLACICSAIRLIDIVKNGTSENQTLVFMRVNLWGIAEVYIGIITACMPVLPAFWKHHFGESESTGYNRYNEYSTNRSIEMLNSRHHNCSNNRRSVMSAHKTPDFGSDENVLITDILGAQSSAKRSSSGSTAGRLKTDEDEELAQITKTVEIKQTYE